MEFPQINLDDPNFKKEVRLELCKPDKTTVCYLKNAYGITISLKAMNTNTLEFKLPLKIDQYGQQIDNPYIPDMRPYYLVRLRVGKNYEEYYRIVKPKSESTGEEDFKSYYCLSYEITLADKQLSSYTVTSYTINEVLNGKQEDNMPGILDGTNWSVKRISPVFFSMYRSIDSGVTNKLDFILNILPEAYDGCIPIFDTKENEISIYAYGEIGKDLGLTFSFRKYIETFDLEIDPVSEFTTVLHCKGKDGLSIHEVTPSGQGFLENFSYFMQGFAQDEEGNVISSSPYWSDELCKKQIEYEKLLEEKEGIFETLLNNKKTLRADRATKETEAFDLLTSLNMILDRLSPLHGMNNTYYRYDFTYNNSTVIEIPELNPEDKYMVMINTSSVENLVVKLNNVVMSVESNKWKVLDKLSDSISCKIEVSGSAENVDVIVIVAMITDEEYNTIGNEVELIERYCEPKKESEYYNKLAEIDQVDTQIALIDQDIEQLRVDLSAEEHFGLLMEERNNYIIEKIYENQNITSADDLLQEGIKEFEKVNSPALILNLSSANFLDIVSEEAYYDKDKILKTALASGIYDWCTVRHEPHNVNIKCMILEINLDVENSTLNFVFSNAYHILTEDESALRNIVKGSSAGAIYLQEKYKYDSASNKTNVISEILEDEWDAATRSLRGGTNASVSYGRHGIKIVDPQNEMNVIWINESFIGISDDGGKTFRNALNAKGIFASQIIGKLIAGENLLITNEAGTFEINKDGIIITTSGLQIPDGIPDTLIASADEWHGKTDRVDHDTLSDTVDSTIEKVNKASSYFAFRDDGLNIGKTDSPLNINISNEQIDFIDTGQVVAYINGQKMFIDSLEVLTSLLVGAHVIEKYDDETTVIRWVG